MSVRNLRIFSAVCEELNMSRAAEKLYMSQSSVSQAIGQLEKQYSTKLFERLSKKLFLTEDGKRLRFYGEQVLYLIRQTDEKMASVSHVERLRVGACTTVGMYFMNAILSRFEEEQPQTKITVEIDNSSKLIDNIQNARLDLAFVQDLSLGNDMVSVAEIKDRLIFVCHREHKLAGKTIHFDQLAGEAIAVREEGSGTRQFLDQLLAGSRVDMEYSWVCNNVVSMKEAVLSRRCISLMSEHLAAEELERGQLRIIEVKGQKLERSFHLVHHKDKYISSVVSRFIDSCGRQLAEL